MKEAIGTTWTYTLVLVFTLIFTGFLVLSLAYAKAFKVKNEMTTIIEKYEGLTLSSSYKGETKNGSIQIINQFIENANHKTMGKCDISKIDYMYYASNNLSSNTLTPITSSNANKKYYYCIGFSPTSCTFDIQIFYYFSLQFLGSIHKYSIIGKSNKMNDVYILNNTYCD